MSIFMIFILLVGSVTAQRILNEDAQCLGAHNMLRALHTNTPNLIWDSQLARGSARYAQRLAREGKLHHSNSNSYGENLYMVFGAKGTCAQAIKSWYDESKRYNYNSKYFNSQKGHFTQLVWKDTTKLGVGIAFDTRTKTYAVVARYTSAGNVRGRFTQNVQRRKAGARVPSLSQLNNASQRGRRDVDSTQTPKTRFPDCRDLSKSCKYYKPVCGSSEWTLLYCPKTCNFC